MNPTPAKRILVIDDEDGIRDIIQFSLEAIAGWEVLSAASGQGGVAIAQTEQPDAILLDVMMPDLDGPSAFQQLQGDPRTWAIPTIFLTAKARTSECQKLSQLGIAGIITKPFDPQHLVEQIRTILAW